MIRCTGRERNWPVKLLLPLPEYLFHYMTATTIPELLRNTAAKFGDRLALRQPDGKDVHMWTWNEYLTAAEEIAAGLHARGIRKGDHIALCSETRAEFYLADMGILTNGSVAAALYPSYPPDEL